MQLQKPHANKHYRARLIAWTLAMLAWLAWAFGSDRAAKPRHMRQRFGFVSLDGLARNVALLIVIRACELAGVRRRKPFLARQRGREAAPRHAVRSLIGGRLRRALKHKDFTTRVAILADALRRLDDWAAAQVKRRRRGMKRLWPVLPKPEAAAPHASLAAPEVCFADSS